MAKTLEFTDTSAQTVKIGDTTTSFTMVLGEDSNPVDLTNATGIVAKLGNSTGYLKSQTITPDNIQDPLSGKVVIKFDSNFMNGLPAGYYLLEVWVTYGSGTAIYPSGDLTGFTINNNIESQSGSVIATITFDDFVEAMNKAASTIAKGDKGDKGDTGTVDNAGLINAPAFQSLQAQVDNSAVGTNLLTNTSDLSANWSGIPSISTTTEYDGHPSMVFASNLREQQLAFQSLSLGKLQNSTQYTASFWAKADNAGDKAHTELWGSIGATDFVLTTNWVRYTAIVTSASDSETNVRQSNYFLGINAGNKGNVYIALPKLEKGSLATDWCPNPSEILTQSDYAKIKAAIVALGGALS